MKTPPTTQWLACNSDEVGIQDAIHRACHGETEAFAEIIDQYQKPLYNTALRMTGNTDDAKDITQSAFIKAYERLDTYNFKHKFFSWLYRILINETLNCLRTRGRIEELDDSIPARDKNPEEEFEESEASERIQAALLKLQADYRAVVLMRYFNDMSYREMAFVLKIKEKTVKSRLYTARQILADLLKERDLVTWSRNATSS